MGIRSEVALAIISKYIETAPENVKVLLNGADDCNVHNVDCVGEFNLYVWDWFKWYETDDNIKELYTWLDSLSTNNVGDIPLGYENESYQLVVYTSEIGEVITKGNFDFGLSVGIKFNP